MKVIRDKMVTRSERRRGQFLVGRKVMNSSVRSFVIRVRGLLAAALGILLIVPTIVAAQTQPSLLTSRAELTAAAERAEKNQSGNTSDALAAAAIKQRLREGDFNPGDRIILRVFTDQLRTDTLLVRSGRLIDLPGKTTVSLDGVLRSEVSDKVTAQVDHAESAVVPNVRFDQPHEHVGLAAARCSQNVDMPSSGVGAERYRN